MRTTLIYDENLGHDEEKRSKMPKYDERDPIYHDVRGEAAGKAIIRRFAKWLKLQPEGHGRYFCRHASYVGYHGALKFLCEGCKKDD